MTTFDFSPLFRSTVGFDRLMQLLEDSMQFGDAGNGYPPYNIEKLGDDHYRITLAVAGFGEDELAVSVRENSLAIEGQRKDSQGSAYLYRGIASRAFKRQFQLADHVEVVGASLVNGLLIIELKRELPEAMKPRRIEITAEARPGVGAGKPKVIEGSKDVA